MTTAKHSRAPLDHLADSRSYTTLAERLGESQASLNKRIWELRRVKNSLDPNADLLFFDLDIPAAEYQWLAELLKEALAGKIQRFPERVEKLFDCYPAVFMASLVGTAMISTDRSFWQAYWRNLDVTHTEALYETFRTKLIDRLRKLGFAIFAEAEINERIVGTIELHAGLPAPELVALSTEIEREVGRSSKQESYASRRVATLRAKEGTVGLLSLRNLALHFPERTEELLARVHELHESREWLENTAFEGTHGLPEPTFNTLRKLLSEGEQESSDSQTEHTKTHNDHIYPRPYLQFDFFNLELRLVFPATREGADEESPLEWRLLLDNERTLLSQPIDWATSGYKQYSYTLETPFTKIELQRPDGQFVNLKATRFEKHQFLLLREDGTVLQYNEELPSSARYALLPTRTIVSSYPPKNSEEVSGITGWGGWVVKQLPIESAKKIRFSNFGNVIELKVATELQAKWLTQKSIIRGLRGLNDFPVHHTSPKLLIPRDEAIWNLKYYQYTNQEKELFDEYSVTDDAKGNYIEILENYDQADPWVGTFEVEVYKNGKLQTATLFNIAEGLDLKIEYSRSQIFGNFMSPTPESSSMPLRTAHATLQKTENYALKVPKKVIGVSSVGKPPIVEVKSATFPDKYNLKCKITPPRLRYTIPSTTANNVAHEEVASLSWEEVSSNDDFEISFPETVHDPKLIVATVKEGQIMKSQEVSLTRISRSNNWRCSMAKIVASISDDADYYLIASWFRFSEEEFVKTRLDQAAQRRYRRKKQDPREAALAMLVHIHKEKLLSDAEINDDTITLKFNRRPSNRVEARIWRLATPTRGPLYAHYENCQLQLPEEINPGEPLVVEVHEREIFSKNWNPESPSRNAVFIDGIPPQYDPMHNKIFESWLFSPKNNFLLLGDEVRTIWEARDRYRHLLDSLPPGVSLAFDSLRSTTNRYLRDNPRLSLSELSESKVPEARQISLLIRAGLATRSFRTLETSGEIHPTRWIGLIQEINDIYTLQSSRDLSADSRRELETSQKFICEVGGPALWDITQGVFCKLDMISDSHLELLPDSLPFSSEDFRALQPTMPILTADYRDFARRQVFRNRGHINRITELGELWNLCKRYNYLVDKLHDPQLRQTSRTLEFFADNGQRQVDQNWRYALFISFTMAFLSRMTAHNLIDPICELDKLTHVWATLAEHAPILSSFDLVLAEAYALHALDEKNSATRK